MGSLKQPLDSDPAATRAWQWLRLSLKDGLTLSVCLAILEADEEALRAIVMTHFVRDWRLAEVCSIGCNRALSELNLNDALRTGFTYEKGGGRDLAGMLLVSGTNKTIVRVIKRADQNAPAITGVVEQNIQNAAQVGFAMVKLKEALINGIAAQTRR